MKRTGLKTKKLLLLSAVMIVTLLAACFSISAFAADANSYFTFSEDSIKDPLFISEHFDNLPRAYEAEVNFPSGSYASASPVISNYPASDTRDSFGFEINGSGNPVIYYYDVTYDSAASASVKSKSYVKFNYSVIDKGWVHLVITNEIDSGSSIYKLYVNGALQETLTTYPIVYDMDPIFSQSTTRELSIGNDGSNYFKGQLRNLAVYSNAITASDAKASYDNGVNMEHSSLIAYYDATMSGNDVKYIKDQSGNDHDAKSAFFERTEEPKDYAYSFVFIGDTQFLVYKDANEGTTQYASPMYDWIVQNKDAQKIARVFGLGDITDKNSAIEWKYAVELHKKLEDANIPYSIIPGNHDDYTTPAGEYNKYFGKVSYFTNSITGYRIEGRLENYYTDFEVGEQKYTVIGLLYGAKDDVLEWANSVAESKKDRQIIVITHALLGSGGQWGEAGTPEETTAKDKTNNNGIDIWEKFISQHENIIIAACGHISGDVIKHRTDVGVHGNIVNTFLIDPQGFDKATKHDTGMVAVFHFSEDGKDVQVEYVSTTKTLEAQKTNPDCDDILYHEANQFSFKINEPESASTYTEYGKLPAECIADGNKFALFFSGEYKSGYKTWNEVTTAAAEYLKTNKTLKIQILMLSDYENTSDPVANNALNYANGKLTIDLGGYTFTKRTDFLNLTNNDDITNVSASNILVKNGIIRCGKSAVIHNQITNKSYTAEKTWNLTFEKVTIGYTEGITASKGIIYQAYTNSATEETLGTTTNITFNDCTFDLKTNVTSDTSIVLFTLADDKTVNKIDVNVKVNGGKFLADIATLSRATLYKLNEGSDSITFGAYEGEYTKLVTHTTEKGYANYTGTLPAADGNRYFVEIEDDGTTATYELTSLVTEYGTVLHSTITANPGYLSAVDYPFITFKDGVHKFYANDNYWGMTLAHVKDLIKGSNAAGHTAVVVFRRDYVSTTTPNDSTSGIIRMLGGTFIIDLAGYTFTAKGAYLLDIYSNTNDYVQDTNIIIKNGTLVNDGKTLIGINHTDAQTAKKNYSITLNEVTFKDSTGSAGTIALGCWDDGNNAELNVTLNFNDCVFDFTGAKSNAAMIQAGKNKALTKVKITISGGKIIANKLDSVKLYVLGGEDSAAFTKGKDNVYTTLTQPSSSSAPATTYLTESGEVLTFSLRNTSSGVSVYGLGRIINTPYGKIDSVYDSEIDYPFVLFKEDKTFVGGYADFGDAFTAAIKSNVNYILLARRDATVSKAASGISEFKGSVTVDLDGYTLTTAGYLLDIYLNDNKSMTADATYGTYKITNGTLARGGNKALVCVNYGTKFSKTVNYVLEFEDVTFKATGGNNTQGVITHSWEDGFESTTAHIGVTASFNDCIFDYKNSIDGITMLPTNYSNKDRVIYNVTINGGEIIAKGASDMTRFTNVNDNVNGRADRIVYGKSEDGSYISLILASNESAPTDTYTTDAGEATFIKESVGTDTSTYRLLPTATIGSEFVPKMSITLGNALVVNIYVPANKDLQKIEFNGNVYTINQLKNSEVELQDGNSYYLLSAGLDSSSAASDVILKAYVTIGCNTATGTFTFSIPKYATALLATDNVSAEEEELIYDVLAYIKAAYVYFDSADKATVAEEIDSILGSYEKAFVKADGNVNVSQGLYGAEITLDEMPKIRFILPEGISADGYTFKADGKTLTYTTGTVTIGQITYAYAEISLYAYQMIGDVTYTDGTVSGSYHINSYYDFVTTDDDYKNDANLITLVEALYNYCKSAKAYKTSVTK